MTTKCLLIASAALAVCFGTLRAEQDELLVTKAAPAKPAVVQTAEDEPAPIVDGDDAYKANCSRCHLPPRKFSERKMATIMRHMRVRANLTQPEADAILAYLTK